MTAVVCPNCGGEMRGTPCDVCGYVRRRQPVYPVGHDRLTDSYQTRPEPSGHLHDWRFDGDDPYTVCHGCGERRDARSGRLVSP